MEGFRGGLQRVRRSLSAAFTAAAAEDQLGHGGSRRACSTGTPARLLPRYEGPNFIACFVNQVRDTGVGDTGYTRCVGFQGLVRTAM